MVFMVIVIYCVYLIGVYSYIDIQDWIIYAPELGAL